MQKREQISSALQLFWTINIVAPKCVVIIALMQNYGICHVFQCLPILFKNSNSTRSTVISLKFYITIPCNLLFLFYLDFSCKYYHYIRVFLSCCVSASFHLWNYANYSLAFFGKYYTFFRANIFSLHSTPKINKIVYTLCFNMKFYVFKLYQGFLAG